MGARRRLGEGTASGRRPAGDARGDARAVAASALASTRGIVSGLRRGRRGGGAYESAREASRVYPKTRQPERKVKVVWENETSCIDGRRVHCSGAR